MALTGISRVLSLGISGGSRGNDRKKMPMAVTAGRLAACALIVASCASLGGCDQTKKTDRMINQRAGEAQQGLNAAHNVPDVVAYDPLTVSHKVWGGNAAIRMQRGMPLPSRYEVPRGVTLVSSEPMSLSDIANVITAQTGIPVHLNGMVLAGKKPPLGGRAGSADSSGDPSSPMAYEGPLSGLLDRVAADFDVSWHFDGSSITLSRYETRIFAVEALPGTEKINEGMQDDQSSASGGSGGMGAAGGAMGGAGGMGGIMVPQQNTTNSITQNSKFTIDIKYWDELKQVLDSIVGSQGNVVVSPSMGTVTVTTTSDVMGTVSDYLAKENKRLSRQIAINVQIYSVDIGRSEDFTMAFNSFLNNLSKIARISYTTAAAPGLTNSVLSASNFGSLNVAILNSPNSTQGPASDVFNALSAIGDTTNVAQFPMTTLNNRPVSRRVGTDTTYISTVNQSTFATTSTTTSFTPVVSTVHDGFSLQLTPRLLDDGRILLQYSLSLVGLTALNPTTFNTGSGSIPLDLPTTNNRIFVQQSMLRSGQTLVIGGVDQEQMAHNEQGVGSPDNFLLGGGTSSNVTHLMMFMAITPQVMDVAGGGSH